MAVAIPPPLIDYILLGPTGDRRQLQDSPILGDVWLKFGAQPDEPQELLITPHKVSTAGDVAIEIDQLIEQDRKRRKTRSKSNARERKSTNIAYLQGLIAARLYFDELLRVVVPLTSWWRSSRNRRQMETYLDGKKGAQKLKKILGQAQTLIDHWSEPANRRVIKPELSAFDRYAIVTGLILWGGKPGKTPDNAETTERALANAIKRDEGEIAGILTEIFNDILETYPPGRQNADYALVYQISLNREVSLAVAKSVPAVKADAARSLFTVECKEIAWAVIDSGIQGDHPAFLDAAGKSRVQKSFDFSGYRKIVSLNNLKLFDRDADAATRKRAAEVLDSLLHDKLKNKPDKKQAVAFLTALAEDVKFKRPVHWEFVEPFVEIKIDSTPGVSDHGTHVAGIIGANKKGGETRKVKAEDREDYVDGMCPDIQLYDFRVIADSEDIKDTEFAIIAALQYIRHVNERHDFITIHGANLSLSIPHNVRNYACGRTPVCVECERLIESGVVVVAAAGNFGYQSYQTKDGSYEGYAAFTITDPGNAESVITVGATHRFWPHTYGVSFFSSRGPTGDGRLKPDLVAPGERIRAPFRVGWDDLDGTSMAAPHVSGAAAMLMARYSELIGQPRRIKRILCESATDLGRERSFQGHGMLDVLRAFQSI